MHIYMYIYIHIHRSIPTRQQYHYTRFPELSMTMSECIRHSNDSSSFIKKINDAYSIRV